MKKTLGILLAVVVFIAATFILRNVFVVIIAFIFEAMGLYAAENPTVAFIGGNLNDALAVLAAAFLAYKTYKMMTKDSPAKI